MPQVIGSRHRVAPMQGQQGSGHHCAVTAHSLCCWAQSVDKGWLVDLKEQTWRHIRSLK